MVHSIFPRAISSQVSRPFVRSFAEIVAENPTGHRKLKRSQLRLVDGPVPSESIPIPELSKPQTLVDKVPVREDHGLYAFFRRKSDDTLTGEDRFEVVESPDTYRVLSGMVVSAVKVCLYSP